MGEVKPEAGDLEAPEKAKEQEEEAPFDQDEAPEIFIPLQKRTEDLQLDRFVGKRKLIQVQGDLKTIKDVYYCDVCKVGCKDSLTYLDHIVRFAAFRQQSPLPPRHHSQTTVLSLACTHTRTRACKRTRGHAYLHADMQTYTRTLTHIYARSLTRESGHLSAYQPGRGLIPPPWSRGSRIR